MQITRMRTTNQRITSHPLVLMGLVIGLLALAACQPVRDPAVVAAERTAIASGAPLPATTETPEASASDALGVGPAMATVSTRSLRVRSLPTDDSEVVAAVDEGDTFPVTAISSDGEWIQISIEESPDGLGWISAEFVTLQGDITNIEIVEVAAATEEATGEATEEATEVATEEATEEATAEATEEATVEATPEVTETVGVTETAEVTEEVTPEPTEEAAEVATPEATEEATEEATPEATEEATEEASAGDLGTVTIVTDLPLRVRSEPTAEEENKIGNVLDGEVYNVLAISDDELWVQIEVPELGDGTGWVSAEYVVFNEAE